MPRPFHSLGAAMTARPRRFRRKGGSMTRARVLARASRSPPAAAWRPRVPARRAQARPAKAPCFARRPWAVGWTRSPPIIRS